MNKILCVFILLLIKNLSAIDSDRDYINNSIDQIYVISLDRTPERFLFVKNQLEKLGLKFKKFSAIDGKSLIAIDELTGQILYPKDMCRESYCKLKKHYLKIKKLGENAEISYFVDKMMLSPGEFGCFMSHIAVWKDVIEHKYKKVIIFEDDIKFQENFLSDLSLIIRNLPQNFDVFFLDIGMNKPFAEKTYFVPPSFWLSGFFNTSSYYYAGVKHSMRVWGLHAYVITCDSAQKLLKLTKISNLPVDNMVILSKLKLYVSKIKLLSGNNCESEISKLRNIN